MLVYIYYQYQWLWRVYEGDIMRCLFKRSAALKYTLTNFKASNCLKGNYVAFKEEIQIQNFNIYNINEVLIQT